MTAPVETAKAVICGNDAHGPRKAKFRVTFPNDRYNPTTACLSCARMLVAEAAGGGYSIHLDIAEGSA